MFTHTTRMLGLCFLVMAVLCCVSFFAGASELAVDCTKPTRWTKRPKPPQVNQVHVIDIQRSPDWARDLLAKIADVKTGALPSWERIGNAYRLYMSADGGLVEDRIDSTSGPQRFPLEELEAAVTAWLEVIG